MSSTTKISIDSRNLTTTINYGCHRSTNKWCKTESRSRSKRNNYTTSRSVILINIRNTFNNVKRCIRISNSTEYNCCHSNIRRSFMFNNRIVIIAIVDCCWCLENIIYEYESRSTNSANSQYIRPI